MTRLPKLIPFAILGGLILTLTAGVVPAQQPLPPLPPPGAAFAGQAGQPADPNAQPGMPEGAEVLARGPVHEAYASTAENTTQTPVVEKKPPEPIEELPPDQKPEGENVQWMPGYWHWDDDANQFIWISGFWRAVPPGRVWVPGSWREARGGWQWVQGFWQEPDPQQPAQPEIQYLPEPPATVEVGPSVAAPTNTSFYIPGSWVWRGRYVWRPGVWIEYRPNWVWVPAHFRWTPVGYVFVDGYWDYALASRGVLFAPVAFTQPIYTQPAFVYTPTYVVSEPAMFGALFVRRGWGNYYFGDYFGPRYGTIGFNAWCGTIGPRGVFAVGFGVGRTWGYDPLWSYYSVAYRNDRNWHAGVNTLYAGRYIGTIAAPPRTLVQQNTVINKITNVNVTNVTNNVTVVNKNVTVNNKNVTEVAMLAPIKVAKDLQPEAKVRPISADVRKKEAQEAKQIREVAVQRTKLETAAVAKGPAPKDAPRTLKLDVPKTVVARAQMKDDKQPPPANPLKDAKAATKVDPKADHKIDPHPVFNPNNPNIKADPKGKVDPKVDPKGKVDPKVDPKGKVDPKTDPKGKVDPKVDPKIDPKGKVDPKIDPKGKVDPKVDPKADPKGKVDPKGDPKGKVDPKIDPKGKVDPKIDPKGKVDPKGDPKGKGEPPPGPKGKGDPKDKEDPKKKDKDKEDPKPPPVSLGQPTGGGPAPLARVRPPAVNPTPVAPLRPLAQPPAAAQPARLPATQPKLPAALPKQPAGARPVIVQPKPPAAQPRVAPKVTQPRVAPKMSQPRVQPRVTQPKAAPKQAPAGNPNRKAPKGRG
jgi:hypothetical protein